MPLQQNNDSNLSTISETPTTVQNHWLQTQILQYGLTLLLTGLFGFIYTVFIGVGLFQLSRHIPGFRFLLSMSVADALMLLIHGCWIGTVILRQDAFFSGPNSRVFSVLSNVAWFPLCYHYPLVAWSRFAAIQYPVWFKTLDMRTSIMLCMGPWVLGILQTLLTLILPFWSHFYLDAKALGSVADDFSKYLNGGTWHVYTYFNTCMMVVAVLVYVATVYKLYKKRNQVQAHGSSGGGNVNLLKFERNLLIACVLNTVIFFAGQVVFMAGFVKGRMGPWVASFLLMTNSVVNPFLFVIFSSKLREELMNMVKKIFKPNF